eukprot:196121-Rhodomonas_salina.1
MDFDWGSEFDHLCAPWSLDAEIDEIELGIAGERKRKRDQVMETILTLAGHYLKYPGCAGKYCTPDAEYEFRYKRLNFIPWAHGMGDSLSRKYYCMPFAAFRRLVDVLGTALDTTYVSTGRWNSASQASRSSGKH